MYLFVHTACAELAVPTNRLQVRAMLIVWMMRGRVISTFLCCIVCHSPVVDLGRDFCEFVVSFLTTASLSALWLVFFVCVYFVLCFLIVLSLVGNASAVDYLGRLFYWGPVVCIKWHVSSHCGEASCKLLRVYSVYFSYFIIKWDFITLFTHAESTHTSV